MRLDYFDSRCVCVTLSKRNLLSLLHKVDDSDSYRTITLNDEEEGICVVVMAEPDMEHYDREPGEMSLDTEDFIQKNLLSGWTGE